MTEHLKIKNTIIKDHKKLELELKLQNRDNIRIKEVGSCLEEIKKTREKALNRFNTTLGIRKEAGRL